jgi:5-methylcytosine-specific restriction endonuclease McrA
MGNTCYRQALEYKQQVRERDNYTCQLCGAYGDQVDHIIPWAVSHDSQMGNLRVLCKPCNLSLRRTRSDAALSYNQFFQYIESELIKV